MNGIASFQCIINIIAKENLHDTLAHVDNVTICCRTQHEHDTNIERFLRVAKKYNLTFNRDKSILLASSINLLGYSISNGYVRRDPEYLQVLPLLHNLPFLRWEAGMFSSYLQGIVKFCSP